ncbi:MAG: hypothetical protein Q4C87_01435 [Actinomycetaceae bacterium]|nr:hypothetical protein [Actinomycetaceae bacterium]
MDIAPDTECIVGDGGIGCHDQSHKKVELFNASTGEFVAEVADVPSVDWYRDGFTIVDWGSEERETRYYSWTGERKEEPSAVPFPHLPYQDQELLVSITPARDRVRNPVFVNPQGDSLVESTYATAGHVYKDLSTNQVIATKNNRVEVSGDEKGTVYLLIDRALGAFRFIDENGKEIFFEEYGQKESLGAHHGILVHHSVESVTVYAPQG